MTDSPSLLLQRAANALEQMAKDADGGPWRVEMLPRSCAIKTAEGSPWPGDHVANIGNRFSASWVATMSPVVAAPLVAWLREAAAAFEAYGDTPGEFMQSDEVAGAYGHTYRFMHGALNLARLVLGVSAKGSERSDPQDPLET